MTQRYGLSLGLFSAVSLALEITLTRLLSTVYYPPFIFLVLSMAVLGIALGAALISAWQQLRQDTLVPIYMLVTGLLIIAQAVGLPVTATFASPIPTSLLLLCPYVAIGMALATIFSHRAAYSQLLYAYDLAGAGLGALLIVPLLTIANPLTTLLLLANLALVAGWVYRRDVRLAGLAALGIVLTVMNSQWHIIAVDMTTLHTEKPIQEALADGGRILETRWDAFARTDLVQPADNQPYRLYVDGAAASVIPPATDNNFLQQDIGLFAFATAQPEQVFIIGSGGGLDVWFAQQVGAEVITAVEVNARSVSLVRDYSVYSGGIYDDPAVQIVVDEGRSVLRRQQTSYDLIYLSQVVTQTAERTGYALTENAVFTTEAFDEYWEHLSDEGYLALKLYDEPTLSRALALVMELLTQQGMSDQEALRHTVTLLSPETSPPTPLLIVRKTPFTEDESAAIGRVAQRIGFASLYLPYIQVDPPLNTVASGANTFDVIIDASTLDLSPPTDDRPFFYQFERGLPQTLVNLCIIVAGVVAISIISVLGLAWREQSSRLLPLSVYFAGLGAGFMLVELALIQTTRLFIGHPTLAVTVVLAALLIGGGAGSTWHHRRQGASAGLPSRLLLLIGLLIGIWWMSWQFIAPQFMGAELGLRLALVVLILLPLAFTMGIPFAAGLRYISHYAAAYVPLAWAINGVFTVVGTTLAVVLALTYGYTSVFIAGAVIYGMVFLASWMLR